MTNETGHILIVDDEPSALYTVEMLLASEQYRVSFAEDGRAALDKIAAEPPDVVLMDVMMPSLTGYDVCRRLKEDPLSRHIPVILVTALDQTDDVVRGFESGADEFLTKPVEGPILRARVRSMLRIKRQYDALQETLVLREKMAHTIVHDMRNPLATILLYARLLEYGEQLRRPPGEIMEAIRRQAQRLDTFLGDLLLTAKMSSGQLLLNCVDSDLNELLARVIQNHEPLAAAKKITLRLETPAQKSCRPVDARLFERAIDNILSNAVKYSLEGGEVLVRLEQRPYREETPLYCLEVRDEGRGIPEAYRERIFDEYVTVPLDESGVDQTGLGLALVKLVVEAHGGRISAHPNQPQGTRMTIEL